MRKSRFFAIVGIGLGAVLLLWLGRSNENATTPGRGQAAALRAPTNDTHLTRTEGSRPQLSGTEHAGAAQPEDPDAWAGGRPIQRMQLPAVTTGAERKAPPQVSPEMTPAQESTFLAAKHQALQMWSAAAQQVLDTCVAPLQPAEQGAREPRAVHVDVSFAPRPRAGLEGQSEHVFVAEWLHTPPPLLDAIAAGRDRHLLEGCLARLQAIELHIDTGGAAGAIEPDLRLAESIAIQM